MTTPAQPYPQVKKRSIGQDFEGNDVIATFTVSAEGTQVRFEGIVKPTNRLTTPPTLKLSQDVSGGWYVDSALVCMGFRFDGGWNIPFNASAAQGKRRLFANRKELARILIDAGYFVDESTERVRPDCVANLLSVKAASAAITAHSQALGLEGDEEILVWQLVASLHEFSAAQGIRLSKVIEDVCETIKRGDVGLPAARAAIRKSTA